MNLDEAQRKYGSELARPVAETWELVLQRLQESAQKRALAALAAVFLRAGALDLADLLSGQPLEDARAVAATFQQAIDQAAAALKAAQESHATRTLATGQASESDAASAASTLDDGEIEVARRAVWEAKKAAFDSRIHVNHLEAKITALRGIPGPDERDLSLLAAALDQARRDHGNRPL